MSNIHMSLRTLFVVICILGTNLCHSQINYNEKILNREIISLSIANKDLKESFTKSNIRNYREEALKALNTDSISKFIQLLAVRKANFDNVEYLIFSNPEFELGNFVVGNYQIILNQLITNPKINKWGYRHSKDKETTSYFYDDNFYESLTTILASKKDFIRSDLGRLNEEQNQILKIYLSYQLALQDIKQDSTFESLFSKVELFESKYPNSEYRDFTSELKKLNYTKGDIGLASMLSTGVYIPTSGLADHFSFSIPISGAIEANYKFITLAFGFGYGIGQKIQKEFESDTLWLKGDNTGLGMGEILLGVNVYQSERLNIFLKSGIRGYGVVPPGDDRYEDIENVTSSSSLNYGIGFDYKWKPKKPLPLYSIKSKKRELTNFIRVHFNYQNPSFDNKVSTFDGAIYLIRIAFGQQILFPKRIK
ncbi:hypothetical protein [Ekhidna sp. To15]|uniref:hypothetical protein n=1 Tax=Ekhidna sp. To15 TaxID=3395267 RepID=UPI003F5287BB